MRDSWPKPKTGRACVRSCVYVCVYASAEPSILFNVLPRPAQAQRDARTHSCKHGRTPYAWLFMDDGRVCVSHTRCILKKHGLFVEY